MVEVKKRKWDKYYPGKIIKINKPLKKKNRKTGISYDIEFDDKELEILKNIIQNGKNRYTGINGKF